MKKNEKIYKVDLNIPTKTIEIILNADLTRFEEAKYLVLAHYYYNSDVVYTAKDLNKYLGIKETTGKEIRIKMVHMGIITPTHLASYAKDAQGRYYRKGYDMYAGNITDEKIKYTLLSTDGRMLINKYSGEVADMLQVVIQPSNGHDVNKYIKIKDKYKNNTTDILLSATAKETILLNTSVVDIKEDISQPVEEDIMNKSLLIDDLEDLDFNGKVDKWDVQQASKKLEENNELDKYIIKGEYVYTQSTETVAEGGKTLAEILKDLDF